MCAFHPADGPLMRIDGEASLKIPLCGEKRAPNSHYPHLLTSFL